MLHTPGKYNLYVWSKYRTSTETEKEMWDQISKLSWGAVYEVYDSNGEVVPEFIPF